MLYVVGGSGAPTHNVENKHMKKQSQQVALVLGVLVGLMLVPEVAFAVQNANASVGAWGDTLVDKATNVMKWVVSGVAGVWAVYHVVMIGREITKNGRGGEDLPGRIGRVAAGIVVVFGAFRIVPWLQQLFGAQIGAFA